MNLRKRYTSLTAALAAAFSLLTGCESPLFDSALLDMALSPVQGTLPDAVKEKAAVTLEVRLSIPQSLGIEVDFTAIEVKLQSKSSPVTYIANPDAQGVAQFDVQPGSYDILASAYYRATRTAVSGSIAEFLLTDKGIASSSGDYLPPSLDLDLNVAVPNALVIREIYYHGSNTLDGASYDKDRYVELYNNSGFGGRTVFLDSLCLSTIFPYNSTTGNNAWAGRDTIALAQMFWVFPGNGSTYPLHPGESCVVALSSAVDHSARATSGIQLNRAHFGAYAEHLTKHEIAAGVPSLVCYMAGQGTAWAFSIHSPAVVIFKPEMGVDAYRRDAATWERYEPGKNSGTKYWHIAKEWIIDGVECVDSPQQSIKRLPSSVDASYVYMRLPHYSGKCVTRKVEDEVQGVKVYQDTNNSEADFAYDQPLNPQLR